MNILLIILIVFLIWRIAADMKRGIVRSLLAFINTLFAALIIGLLVVAVNAYHAENYLAIGLVVVIIAVLSAVYSVVKLVFFPARVITKLPLISSVDKLLGVVIGVAETLIAFWALCYALMFIDLGVLQEQLLMMIGENPVMKFLYEYNLIGLLLEMVKAKIGLV